MNRPSQWLAALPGEWLELKTASGFALGIFVIAGVTLLAQIWDHFRYRRELGWIATAQRQIELEINGGELELLAPAHSEAIMRLRAVASCGEKGFPPSLADLNEAVEAREDSTFVNRFQNVVLSTLLIIGLLGTLWSLQPALRSPGKLFTEKGVDTAQVDAYVKQVQDGMGGAFSASICGLLCTVVLVFTRSLFIMGKRNELFAALDTFTLICLIPRYVPTPISSPKALREASSRLDKVSLQLDTVATNLATAASNANISGSTLDSFVTKLNTAADTIGRLFAEAGTVELVLLSFRDTTAKLESLHAGQIAEAVADRNQIANAIAGMSDAVKGFRETQGTVMDALKTVDANQAGTVASYEAALSAFKKEAQGWLRAMREEGNKRSQEIEATLTAVQSNQTGTVTAYQQALTALEEQMEGGIKSMQEQTRSRADEIAAVLKVVSDSGSRLEAAGADVSKAASDILASSEAQKGTTQTLATHLRDASNKQNEALKAVIARLGSLESLEKRLSELPKLFNSNAPRPSAFSIPSQGIGLPSASAIDRVLQQRITPSAATHLPTAALRAELAPESILRQASPEPGILPPLTDYSSEVTPAVEPLPVITRLPHYSIDSRLIETSSPVKEVDRHLPTPESFVEPPAQEPFDAPDHQVEEPVEKKGLLRRLFPWRK